MDEERSFCYTLIIGVCIIICCLLLGRMLLFPPTSPSSPTQETEIQNNKEENEQESIVYSEAEIMELLQSSVPNNTIQNLNLKLRSNGTVYLSGTVDRKDILQAAGNSFLLRFLPAKNNVEALFTLKAVDGKAVFQANEIKVSGISLPNAMQDEISDMPSETLNNVLEDANISPKSILVTKGKLEVLT